MEQMAKDRYVVMFDEDCGFCRWSAKRIGALDRRRRLRFASIQGQDGAELLSGLTPEQRLSSMHVAAPDGHIESAGAALVLIAGLLPGARPLARIGSRFPTLAERSYRAVADRRSELGRLIRADACRLDPSAVDHA